MLRILSRDTLKDSCITNAEQQTIIIPTNCVGAMGAGAALAVREKWPHIYQYYRAQCSNPMMHVNHLISAPTGDGRRVLLLPTKDHFKDPAIPEVIIDNIDKVCDNLDRLKIESIASVYLGTGKGWLKGETKRMLHEYLEDRLAQLHIDCTIYQ